MHKKEALMTDREYYDSQKTKALFNIDSDIRYFFEKRTISSYQTYELPVPIFGYILTAPDIDIPEGYYLFALYCKIPGKKILYIDDMIYRDFKECERKTYLFIRYFSFWAFSSRHLIENRG